MALCVNFAHQTPPNVVQTRSLALPLLNFSPYPHLQHIMQQQTSRLPSEDITAAKKKSCNSFLIADILRPTESVTNKLTDCMLRCGEPKRKRKIWNPLDSDGDENDEEHHGVVDGAIEPEMDVPNKKCVIRVTLSAATSAGASSTVSSPLNDLVKMTRRSLGQQKSKERRQSSATSTRTTPSTFRNCFVFVHMLLAFSHAVTL